MIEHYYLQGRCRSLRHGPLGPSLDGFAGLLFGLGFTKSSARPRILIVGDLSKWLGHRRIRAKDLNEQHVADFLKARRKKFRHGSFEAPALTLLLRHLRQTAVIPQPVPPPAGGLDLIQQDYAKFLSRERGLAQITMRGYLSISRRFLSERFGAGKILLDKLCFQDVVRFILDHTATRTPGGVHLITSVLRSFLGFLYQRGHLATNLARAVPPVAGRHSTEPPPTLSPGQIKRLLRRCDRDSYTGKRDYTVLLLLARLGLRACEVVRLTLDDINWEAGELLIRGKGGREDRLPLPQDVGKALADYLVPGRKRVFLGNGGGRGVVEAYVRQLIFRSVTPTLPKFSDSSDTTSVGLGWCFQAGRRQAARASVSPRARWRASNSRPMTCRL
jgi:site-specific recombinase XerD